MKIGDSESESFWKATFNWLKGRGLKGVDFIISDHHKGLVKAAKRCLAGSSW